MTPPGHFSPCAGFEAPLEMLAACQGRIERPCDTLHRSATHVADLGVDAQAREAARAVMSPGLFLARLESRGPHG